MTHSRLYDTQMLFDYDELIEICRLLDKKKHLQPILSRIYQKISKRIERIESDMEASR